MNTCISVPLIDYVRDWLKNGKYLEVRASTYDRMITSAAALERFSISQITVETLTEDDFRNYVSALIDYGYSYATIKKQMRIVSVPIREAYEKGLLVRNPCVGVRTPSKSHIKHVEKEIIAYTKEEQERVRAVLGTNRRIGYSAIELMLETGMRAGEILALNWTDVFLERKRIRVHSTVVNLANKRIAYVQEGAKSETSNRWVPLSPRAIQILTRLRDNAKYEWLFDNGGDRLSYEALRWQCLRVCRDAEVEYRGLHIWRHTFATNQYYKGTDVKILSKLLGHADTTITYNLYIHLYGDGFEDMLNAVCDQH